VDVPVIAATSPVCTADTIKYSEVLKNEPPPGSINVKLPTAVGVNPSD